MFQKLALGSGKYTSAINTAWSFSFCIEMSRANACGWLGWDDGGKSVNGSPCFWLLSIKGTKLSASSIIALLTLKAGKSLLYTNMSIYKPNVDSLLSNAQTVLQKIILPYVLSYICKLDTNLACGKKQCKDDDCKD